MSAEENEQSTCMESASATKTADRPHNYTLWLSCAAVMISVVSALFSLRSSNIAQKQFELAQQARKEDQRPRIEQVRLEIASNILPGVPIIARLGLKNFGKTPATNVVTAISLGVSSSMREAGIEVKGSKTSSSDIGAGVEAGLTGTTVLSRDQVAAIAEGRLFLYYIGTIEYSDTLVPKERHLMKWCGRYPSTFGIFARTMAACEDHNSSN